MDEDVFNQQIRKFLKKVGITSQREIEMAVRTALDKGKLQSDETLQASMTLQIPDIDLSITIDDSIRLS